MLWHLLRSLLLEFAIRARCYSWTAYPDANLIVLMTWEIIAVYAILILTVILFVGPVFFVALGSKQLR